jgi:hypothetical protein
LPFARPSLQQSNCKTLQQSLFGYQITKSPLANTIPTH